MQNQAIQVKGLQKSYKKLHVLKGVDFEVKKSSIFALLGSNEAGMTTVVKILTTLSSRLGHRITPAPLRAWSNVMGHWWQ